MDVFEEKYGNPLENDGPRGIWEKAERGGNRAKSVGTRYIAEGIPLGKNAEG
jgi:hypothetical protein